MRFVIVVRHGSETRWELNEIGRGQAERLAQAIGRHMIGTGSKKVFSPSLLCAIDTGAIIAAEFGVTIETCEALMFDEPGFGELQMDAAEQQAGENCDVLILVTTGEKSPAAILDAFRKSRFFKPIGPQDTMHGCARALNLISGEQFLLP